LIICGLIAGLCAGLAAAAVGTIVGEPAIDEAIAYEDSHAPHSEHHAEPLVSRGVQSGPGLFGSALILGLSMGGLFALSFAAVYGRIGSGGPRQTASWLALAAFVVVFLIPFLKYPAAPPGVGDPDTIGERTLVYVTMVAISVLLAVAGVRLYASIAARADAARAALAAVGFYAVAMLVAAVAMPVVDEVPADFPATTLWDFRIASLGTQAVLWAVLGTVFAVTATRVMTGRPIVEWRRPRPEVKSA
jgi:predicted cobalt transporter CbtA